MNVYWIFKLQLQLSNRVKDLKLILVQKYFVSTTGVGIFIHVL